MNIYRIDNVAFAPVDIIAEDRDHAAQTFIHALMRGLQNRPDVRFDVSEWTALRLSRFDTHRRWAEERRAGIVWSVDDGAWELNSYALDRG